MNANLPRYCSQTPLPPYTYVPGLTPHPTSDPQGHSFGHADPKPRPLANDSYRENTTYLYAIDLFNHGYYWEAHEAWESLWHAAGRTGHAADFLKGLIKLAAAGVKLKEGNAVGVRRHAKRAAELFEQARSGFASATVFGLDAKTLVATSLRVAHADRDELEIHLRLCADVQSTE